MLLLFIIHLISQRWSQQMTSVSSVVIIQFVDIDYLFVYYLRNKNLSTLFHLFSIYWVISAAIILHLIQISLFTKASMIFIVSSFHIVYRSFRLLVCSLYNSIFSSFTFNFYTFSLYFLFSYDFSCSLAPILSLPLFLWFDILDSFSSAPRSIRL